MPTAPSTLRRGPGRPPGSHSATGRTALLAATRELLADRGPDRLTLREVAQRAGVQPTLVHYYFGGRRDLLAAVVEEVAAETRAAIRQAAEQVGSSEARIKAMVAAIVEMFAEHPYLPRLVVEQMVLPDDEQTDRFVRDVASHNLLLLQEVLERGQAAGELAPTDLRMVVPAVMGTTLLFFLGAPLMRRLLDVDPADPGTSREFARVAGDFVWNALRTREAP